MDVDRIGGVVILVLCCICSCAIGDSAANGAERDENNDVTSKHDEIQWESVDDQRFGVEIDRYAKLWKANQSKLVVWRGELSFEQEMIISGDTVRGFVKEYKGDEARQMKVGQGEFLVDLQADLQRSFCSGEERYYSVDDFQKIGKESYQGAFGVISRRQQGKSFWFEPTDRVGEFIRSNSNGLLGPRTGNGAFRIDTSAAAASQALIGRVLDPVHHLMFLGRPLDERFQEFVQNRQMRPHLEFEIANDECSMIRITISTSHGIARYVFSAEAAGNLVEQNQVILSPKSPLHEIVRRIEFDDFEGVILPKTVSQINTDVQGRIDWKRTEKITNIAINERLGGDEFEWKAFKPRAGQIVFDGKGATHFIFDNNLELIKYSPEQHGPRRPAAAARNWMIVVNFFVCVGILGYLAVRRRNGSIPIK